MSLLVLLFVWIYARHRQPRVALWITGWVFIVLHFANGVVMANLQKPKAIFDWLAYATLVVSGTSFILSVSRACNTKRSRSIFVVGIIIPTLLYWAAVVNSWKSGIAFQFLLAAILLSGVAMLFYSHGGTLRTYLASCCLLAPAVWLWPQLPANPGYGMDYLLFLFFATAGVLYARIYGISNIGAVVTLISFIAWGLVFPIGEVLDAFKMGPPDDSAFWDLEKYAVAFGMLLTLFEEKTQIANEVARRYKDLFDGSLAAVYVCTLDGELLDCNSAFLRMFGFNSKAEAMQHRLQSLHLSPESCAAYLEMLSREGRVIDYEVEQRRKDGSRFWMLKRAVLVTNAQGQRVVESTAIDITERKRGEEAARAANQAKSTFLATVSHEIRTPMNGILGMTELVLDSDLTARQREDLQIVRSSAESLLTVINDVLDFSKIEAGKLELEAIPFHVEDLIEDLVKLMRFRAHEKGLTLDHSITSDVPRLVLGDPGRLRQVLLNLVGNAIKFTDDGGVRIDTSLDSESGEGVRLHLCVTDTGIGIPIEKRQMIFDPFTQAEQSTTRRFGGTGLGLAISSKLVKLMNGRMWIDDGPEGRGTAFHFALQVTAAPEIVDAHNPASAAASIRLNILLAEDNPVNQVVAVRMLERDGHVVTLARTGLEAAERAAREQFDLVLMDIEMPIMDGLEATRRIRADERQNGRQHVPIMAMTANASKDDEARCLSAGMDGFFTKPFTAEKLRSALEARLGSTAPQ